MNDKTNNAAHAVAYAGGRNAPPKPLASDWKPDPCLLTRREMKALVAKELG